MIWNQFIIHTCLFFIVIIIQIQTNIVHSEDLVDEYYTTAVASFASFLPQDEGDALAIINSNKNEQVMASIFPYRDKIRRNAIACKILQQTNYNDFWISRRYKLQKENTPQRLFKDLVYALIYHEDNVLSRYIGSFFKRRDETWITIAMVLIKDIEGLAMTYNNMHFWGGFHQARKGQRHPYENMLAVWVGHKREPIETEELNKDTITKDVNALRDEQNAGGWHEARDQLELILMKKSIKYARKVIEGFEAINANKTIECIINENIQSHGLNHDLADAYISLAAFIKNKHKYTADLLRKYSDGSDKWAAWIMCIAVIHPGEWPKIDEEFKKDHKDDSLTKFILQKLTTSKIMAETIAVIIDPTFKPTTFSRKAV